MGKYTSLAWKVEEPETQEKCVNKTLDNTCKHTILISTASNPVSSAPEGVTNLRTTNLTNLTVAVPLFTYTGEAPVTCVHETTVERCAVCNGFVRWLIADDARMSRARVDPEGVRREFWRMVWEGE
jgi:hypothetical protein